MIPGQGTKIPHTVQLGQKKKFFFFKKKRHESAPLSSPTYADTVKG